MPAAPRHTAHDTLPAVRRPKLVIGYFALPPLALLANWFLVVKGELVLPFDRRSSARLTPAIPAGDRCVRWDGVEGRDVAPSGGRLRVVVKLTNCSRRVWPDRPWAAPPEIWGLNAVRFSARWSAVGGIQGQWLPWRGDLPHAVLPGKSLELPLYVPAPATAGTYWLELRLLQELIGWFDDSADATLRMRVEVR